MTIATTQATVIEKIIAKLQEISGLSEANCFFDYGDELDAANSHDITVTVTIGGGSFSQELDGGGNQGAFEYGSVDVTIWSKISTDRVQVAKNALLDTNKGLLHWKTLILKKLTSIQLEDSGDDILTELMQPRQCTAPRQANNGKHKTLTISFETNFLWDLTT